VRSLRYAIAATMAAILAVGIGISAVAVHATSASRAGWETVSTPPPPAANLPPRPDFLAVCSTWSYDDSPACTHATVEAFDRARRAGGLPPLTLPADWATLSPASQLVVLLNDERTVRGLSALPPAPASVVHAAAMGAVAGTDPSLPASPGRTWGGVWAGGAGNPLEAVYLWMYDDGPGSDNVACPQAGTPGCWGHRDIILMSVHCPWGTPSLTVGAAFAPTRSGGASWAALVVGRCPTQ
jgi:hypothetical protein